MSDSSRDYVMEIRVKPETLRMLFFIAFWTMSFILIAVSYRFNPEAVHDNAILDWSGGVYNLCIFYDHPPATYIAPFLWAVCLLFLVSYLLVTMYETRALYHSRELSRSMYIRRTTYSGVVIVSGCFFSTIFAVQPQDNFMMHAIPFLCIILTLTLLALNNVFLYTRKDIQMNTFVRVYAISYGLVLFLVTFVYLFGYINGLIFKIESLYLLGILGHAGVQALDIAWTVLVSAFPIAHAAYLRRTVSKPVLLRLSR